MAGSELLTSVDLLPGMAVVRLRGDVTAANIDPARRAIAEAIAKRQPKVVIDLSATAFLSSPGLAVLVQALQLSQRNGSALFLAGANDRVRGIFEISRLTDVFRMVPAVEDAANAG